MQTTVSKEREDQLSHGRALAKAEREGKTTITPEYTVKASSNQHTPELPTRPEYQSRPKNSGTKPGAKTHVPKGHDLILSRHQESRATLIVSLVSGDAFTGTIKGRDKFTITFDNVKVQHGSTWQCETITVYKHGIEYFGLKVEPTGVAL